MYKDEEKIQRFKQIWLNKKSYQLLQKESQRLLHDDDRKVTRTKIINNLILEKYGNEALPKLR